MKRSFVIAAAASLCVVLLTAAADRAHAKPTSTTVENTIQATTDSSARRKKKVRRHRAARHRTSAAHPDCNIIFPCVGVAHAAPGRRYTSSIFGGKQYVPRAAPADRRSVSIAGLVAPLAAKLASIQAACPGTVAISGVRHTKIAGTNRWSLHTQGKAVDVQGPYGCIYAQLRGWAGGYSTDAGRVHHIHISYDAQGGREMGLAFRHGGRKKHAHRYARHKRSHYATVRAR